MAIDSQTLRFLVIIALKGNFAVKVNLAICIYIAVGLVAKLLQAFASV